MAMLARAGISPSEYRTMHPRLAESLAQLEADRLEQEAEVRGEELKAVLGHIGSVVKLLGFVQRAIARRPSL